MTDKCHFCGDFIGKYYHYPVHFMGTDVRRRTQSACTSCVALLERIEEGQSFKSSGLIKYAFAKNFSDSRFESFRKLISTTDKCGECGRQGDINNKLVRCGFVGDKFSHYCEDCLINIYRPVYPVNFAGSSNLRAGRAQQQRTAREARLRREAQHPGASYLAEVALQKDILRRAQARAAASDKTVTEVKPSPKILTPREIKAQLDLEVIGQENAKKKLAVMASYYCKQVHGETPPEIEIFKSNVLLLGGTGSGKTLLAKTLAKILEIPFATADATTLTQAGYRGNDVEGILSPLIDDESEAEYSSKEGKRVRGLVFVDEVDKMIEAGREGHDVQHEFLKLCEGTVATVPGDSPCKNNNTKICYVDTRDILFIFAGSFRRLTDIINQRIGAVETIGFGRAQADEARREADNIFSHVIHEDLHKFGFSQELLGRIPIISALKPLDRKDYIEIFSQPKSSVFNQYTQKLKMWGAKLKVTPKAVEEIVDQCLDSKTGARALFAAMEQIMGELLYEIPESPAGATVVIDQRAVKTGRPRLVLPKKRKVAPVKVAPPRLQPRPRQERAPTLLTM